MRVNSILTVVVLFLCGITTLHAQQSFLYGTVSDKESNEFLVGATILTGPSSGVTTDINGEYKITLEPGRYTVTVSYLGYVDKKVVVDIDEGESRELNFKLEGNAEQLGIVVISASQYEKNIAEETVSVEVISKELLEETNSRDLGDALNRTPGVLVQDGQISIRGGNSYSYGVGSRTAVLVDGQSYAAADLADPMLKLVPMESVDQIEVIKGASSVVYGSSALNGAVNVRTIWPKNIEPQTSIALYYGIYDKPSRPELKWWEARQPSFNGAFFNYKQKIKNLQVVVGGNIDFIQSYLELADEFRARVNFKTKYNPEKNKRLSYGVNGNMMWESSDRFFISQDLDSNAYRRAQGSEDRYFKYNIDPHFTYQDDNGHRFTSKLRYLGRWRQGRGETISALTNNILLDNQYQKNWFNRYIITVGMPVTFGISKSNLYPGLRVNYSGATYVQGEFKHERLSLVAGVRYELNKVDTLLESGIPVFRAGLNYQFGKATYVRASWGQAYRLPSIGERFIGADFVDGIYVVPNPRLQVERGWSGEIAVKQGLKFGKNWKGFFDIALFWQEYDNFVEYNITFYTQIQGTLNEFGDILDEDGEIAYPTQDTGSLLAIGLFPSNVDQARVVGYEASIVGEGKIGQVDMRIMMGYTYTYPGVVSSNDSLADAKLPSTKEYLGDAFSNMFRRINNEDEVDNILAYRTRHLLRGDISLTYKKFSGGFTAYYGSFPENIPDLFKSAINLIDGGKRTIDTYIDDHEKGDWAFDIRLGYKINNKVNAGFLVKNLANREYAQRPGKLDPPRSYTLTLGIKL